MKIAFITGMNYLDLMKEGDIAFALAHQVLINKEYANYFINSKQYKIIDNGAAELGKSIEPEELLRAARMINADEIWCPDKLYDKKETLNLTKNFLTKMTEEDNKRFKLVGLAQGRTMSEWIDCYEQMLEMPEISVMAISKYSVECFREICGNDDFSVCREACVMYLDSNDLIKKPLHLAGANCRWINEIKFMKKFPFVRSTDSNIPFKLGVMGLKIDECEEEPNERLNHDIKNLTKEQLNLIKYNINKIKNETKL